MGKTKNPAQLSDRDPVMCVALDDFGIGPAPERQHHRTPTAARHRFGDGTGKAATAADDGYRVLSSRRLSHCRLAGVGRHRASFATLRWLHQRPLPARAYEGDDLGDRRMIREFAADQIDAIGEDSFAEE